MSDALDLIQHAWVYEVAWILLVFTICLFGFPDRMVAFTSALPLLTALIGGQGLIAAAGPEVKRYLEMKEIEVKKK